jgi:hypothetical protein
VLDFDTMCSSVSPQYPQLTWLRTLYPNRQRRSDLVLSENVTLSSVQFSCTLDILQTGSVYDVDIDTATSATLFAEDIVLNFTAAIAITDPTLSDPDTSSNTVMAALSVVLPNKVDVDTVTSEPLSMGVIAGAAGGAAAVLIVLIVVLARKGFFSVRRHCCVCALSSAHVNLSCAAKQGAFAKPRRGRRARKYGNRGRRWGAHCWQCRSRVPPGRSHVWSYRASQIPRSVV